MEHLIDTIDALRWKVSEREKEISDLKAEIAKLHRALEDRAEEEKQTDMFGVIANGLPS
jgi:cell division protein FtsL